MRESGRWVRSGLLVVAVVVAAIGGSAARVGTLSASEAGCGSPPPAQAAGPMSFAVANQADVFLTVYLIGSNENVYAEVPIVDPGTSRPLSTTLAAGDYWLRCVFADGVVSTSAGFTVSGRTTGAVAGYRPVPGIGLTAPAQAYTKWVNTQLPVLLSACRRVDGDVARGDLPAAQTDWLRAHLVYERLGAAYDSFGAFDTELDGLLQGPVTPRWTGFHAIEYALWHHAPAATLRPMTQNLVRTVQALIADFPSEEIDPAELPKRAHQILEDSLEFQLTGAADYGSHTALATAYANTQGTDEVLSVLAPLIQPRDPALLGRVHHDMTVVQTELLAARSPSGVWQAAGNRPRLDADLGALLEQLSIVPNLLAPRNNG
ncbi:MAG TPA: EfeM/EfeO family lipoprotein [Pseudonocardiaceae bacterium]|nr:EfeM/EfeO family lipoprotein [Pseudonocardiaceae bacterium]